MSPVQSKHLFISGDPQRTLEPFQNMADNIKLYVVCCMTMLLRLDIASVGLFPPAGPGPGMHHFASELLMVACHHLDDNHFHWSSFPFRFHLSE